jgi:hypothetical protein
MQRQRLLTDTHKNLSEYLKIEFGFRKWFNICITVIKINK